jgi:integrase
MATRKRRTRSPHPGVVLIPPDPEHGHPNWRARFKDPDNGRLVKLTIAELTTAEARRDWAVRKAKTLGKRRMDLEAGASRNTGTALFDAIGKYYEDHPHLREATRATYKAATDKFLEWAGKVGLHGADDVTAARLVAFKAVVVKEPKRKHARGKKRGKQENTTEQRSPYTINRELQSVQNVLGYLRRLALLPRITSDDLRDGLKHLPTGSARIDYRKPAELQRLLKAALRHDEDTFDATREELAGLRPKGTTPRYTPIGPFVAAALLTGMRFDELLTLTWKHVDLEALDHDGKPVGEIHLTAATKTHRARTVGLEVSPGLRALLAAMKLRSGGKGSVFNLTRGEAVAAEKRLRGEYGAPAGCGWQALRRTCGTYLTNAPGIFGAASAYRSAKQLGHSVAVAEKHYVDVARGIQKDARTLEAAMQIDTELGHVVASVSDGKRRAASST